MEINQQQVAGWLRALLAAGGPLAALVLSKTGMSQDDWMLYTEVALVVIPPLVVAVWGWYSSRKATQIKAVEKMPEIATVVVKDEARGAVGKLAASPNEHNIVTETQNEKDAKKGTKA